MIEFITNEQMRVLTEIIVKILRGRLIVNAVHREKLKDYQNVIRFLASNRISLVRKKRTLLTFHQLIPLLIKPVLHLLNEV